MNERNRSIFRQEAVEKHIREQEDKVLPKFVSPRRFLFFWIVFGMLSGLGVWLCFTEVPVFVSGQGMFLGQDEGNTCQGQKPCILSFFTPDIQPHLIAGKKLMIRPKDQRRWLEHGIVIVASEVLSPLEIHERYHPAAGGIKLPSRTSAVALCRPDLRTHDLRPDLLFEGAFEVRIDAGTRPLASFLPVLERFLGEPDRPGKKEI